MRKRGRSKRGQMQMSFNMIFSIIIIIAIIISSFIVIKWVLGNQRCIQINLFIEDIEREVDKSWKTSETSFTMERNLPTAIKRICFINLNDKRGISNDILAEIREYNEVDNLFLMPRKKACERHSVEIENIKFDNFCVENTGTVNIKFGKRFDEDFVRVGGESLSFNSEDE